MTRSPARLAVVVKGWPRLSETFIAQELVALEKSGLAFEIWSLRHPTDRKTHPLHEELRAPVRYLPEYVKDEPARSLRGFMAARKMPGFESAWRSFRADYARDRTPNRARRFAQACVLASEMPDVVAGFYAHFLHTPSSVARYAAILKGVPWAFSAHAKDIWTSPDWELREKLSAGHHGAAFGATCTGFGAAHLRALADTPDRVDLVYHGLDLKRFPAPPTRAPRPGGAPLAMMSVGRLVEKKGFDRLIAALALLPPDLPWHFTHIGGGTLKDDMRARADKHGVSDRITWRGACDQPEVIAQMQAAHLFVLPSRVATDGDRDGLPNVLMEAASQKLPILSTPVSAIPEFIENGVHGILTDDAPESIAREITAFTGRDDGGADLAEAAYQRLLTDFRMEPGIAQLNRRLCAMMDRRDVTPLAFYAPMKPPDHPVPSGDRTMARGLVKALELAGYSCDVAAHLQLRDGQGCAQRQSELISLARAATQDIIAAGQEAGWRAWITYHSYYKASDLIGPRVARALRIPYLLVEATRARKRLTGPWARFAQLAEDAVDQADAVFYLTERDAEALRAYAPAGQIIRRLRPFLAQKSLPPETRRSGSILSVGMLRHGDKYASYALIAQTLARLETPDWHLQIAGDGPARAEVEALMAAFGGRVSFLGALDAAGVQRAYGTNGILLWPGVNEAFGMTYLEAQAAGLAVVAQARPGVTDVLAPGGRYPAADAGARALASALDALLSDPDRAAACGRAARRYVGQHHLMDSAANTLHKTLQEVL